jgi:hypothetical protein
MSLNKPILINDVLTFLVDPLNLTHHIIDILLHYLDVYASNP